MPFAPSRYFSFVLALACLGASFGPIWTARAQAPPPTHAFVTVWKTETAGTQITLSTAGGPGVSDYNARVDWGDGTTETVTGDDPDPAHTYAAAGTYTVRITGTFPHFRLDHGPSRLLLHRVDQWGAIPWESMERAFTGADSLEIAATDAPDLSRVTSTAGMFEGALEMRVTGTISSWDMSGVKDMSAMFRETLLFNAPIGGWDVSGATDMSQMFDTARGFNQDLSGWNVAGVTDMSEMFEGAYRFNQDLPDWDVSDVTTMASMFAGPPLGGSAFNGDIRSWDVSGVKDMSRMFENSSAFNRDLSGWDVSTVTAMRRMFAGAGAFNHDIGAWDVSGVTDMRAMFWGASAFDQDLGSWDVSNLTALQGGSSGDLGFLRESGLSPANYDALLIGWSRQDLTPGLTLGATRVSYTAAGAEARTRLHEAFGWTVTGDRQVAPAGIRVTDGSRYTPPAITPGTEAVPIGRFALRTRARGPFVNDVTVTLDGTGRGVSAAQLWASADGTFRPGEDQPVGPKLALDPSTPVPTTLRFADVDLDLPLTLSDSTLFLTVDLTSEAAGDVRASIEARGDLVLPGGVVEPASGVFPVPLASAAATLPVELTAFQAREAGAGVALTWTTAAETSNARFDVERTAGQAGPWTSVAQVPGAGTTSRPRTYRITDTSVPYTADTLRYRLRQIDADGTEHVSQEIALAVGGTDQLELKSTFPNPARGQATVRLAIPGDVENARLVLHDLLGREVRSVEMSKTGRQEIQLITSNLASGVYFLRLTGGEATRTQRVTVMR